MKVLYKLNKDLVGRAAAQLCYELNNVKDNIRIINEEQRMINGNSLIGILSGNLSKNNKIEVIFNEENLDKIIKIFNQIGIKL